MVQPRAEDRDAAAAIFGERIGLAQRYAAWLAGSGVERGLVGPHEASRIWQRHLLNCGVVAQTLASASHLVDLGSGAGLPGIPIAIARPDLRVVLVEPLERRVTFLREVVADLGLETVDVRRDRVQPIAVDRRRGPAAPGHGQRAVEASGTIVCRAVAPLERLVPLAAAMAPKGSLLAIKGATISAELRNARDVLAQRCVSAVTVLQFLDGARLGEVAATPVDVAALRDDIDAVDEQMRIERADGILATVVRVDFAAINTKSSRALS